MAVADRVAVPRALRSDFIPMTEMEPLEALREEHGRLLARRSSVLREFSEVLRRHSDEDAAQEKAIAVATVDGGCDPGALPTVTPDAVRLSELAVARQAVDDAEVDVVIFVRDAARRLMTVSALLGKTARESDLVDWLDAGGVSVAAAEVREYFAEARR